MPEIVVTAKNRAETGKNENRRLRQSGLIPGVVYGSAKKPVPVAVSPKEIGAILRSKTGDSTLFDLDLDGTRRKVILKEYQVEPIKGKLLHADFYEVALDKAIEVRVHIELAGTPVGVKTQGGVLEWLQREVEVSCLPTDIPEKITVDISNLELGKHLRVQDLPVPPKVEIVTDSDVVVVHVVMPRAEEEKPAAEVEAAAAGAPAAEPEVIKKGKAEGEAPAAEDKGGEKKAEKKEKK
jgi:large subunit ribosomal protein L25